LNIIYSQIKSRSVVFKGSRAKCPNFTDVPFLPFLWKNRVKGRDWYDLVWYTANHPQLHLAHLEQRMRQSGDWKGRRQLIPESFKQLLSKAIDNLVVDQARKDAEAFIRDPKSLAIWSQEFFQDIADRIQPV